jgi:D-alanine-D-alanine ligase
VRRRWRGARVAVLMGGLSSEREISVQSGEAVVRALRGRGYRAIAVPVGRDLATRLARVKPHVAFNALHGRYGEDGAVQGLLEMLAIPYTGPGILTSALAMDKTMAKTVWRSQGLPTPRWIVVDPKALRVPPLPAPLPLVVKPNSEGSSVGVSIVRKRRALRAAIALAGRSDAQVVIEAYVPGREVTVGILDGRPLGALEVIAKGEFHSYEVKYTAGREEFFMPARLSKAMTARVLDLAARAHAALGGGAYSRVDMRVDGGRPYLIELNTLPGLTAFSYLPRIAAHVGMDFPDLCEANLALATLGVRESRR